MKQIEPVVGMVAFEQILWFIFLGLLGGITYVFINSDSVDDLKKFEAFKRYILGGIVGFLYFQLYSDYSFPNSIMCFVSGYMGTTFIEGLIDKFGPKEEEKGES